MRLSLDTPYEIGMLSVVILVFTDKEVWQDAESFHGPDRSGGESGWLVSRASSHLASQPKSLDMHIARKSGRWFWLCFTDQTSLDVSTNPMHF